MIDPLVASEMKLLVERGYDACAREYSRCRAESVPPEVADLSERLAPASRILDVGCGAGVPVTRALAERHRVTGVDISAGQLALARSRVPAAAFLHGDIMTQAFAADSFDAAVCYYALFHLPRPDQEELVERLAAWLRPGGLVLATLADEDALGYVEPEFFGVRMFWSHFRLREYRRLLSSSGFRILEAGTSGHGYSPDAGVEPERHPYVLVERVAAAERQRR